MNNYYHIGVNRSLARGKAVTLDGNLSRLVLGATTKPKVL